jgi:tartrate-resistant acid phosphatase type 5
MHKLVSLTLALAACQPTLQTTGGGLTKTPTDPTVPTVTAPTSGNTDGQGTDPTITDPGTVTGTTPTVVEPTPVRFIAYGDAGTGEDIQYQVNDMIAEKCAVLGCDFAIYLGDNFYESGVNGLDDEQFLTKFEDPTSVLDFPFYPANGNHDVGGDSDAQVDIYVQYTDLSDRWTMPAEYYSVVAENVEFFAMNTNSIGGDQAQQDWLRTSLDASTAEWKIIYGHHPYKSNGDHGNGGGDLAAVFEDIGCGRVDVSFSGHDHDLQWLEPVCGMELIVSGAGAKQRSIASSDNPTFFERGDGNGFMWVEIVGDKMTGVFYDVDGTELFSRTVTKSAGGTATGGTVTTR